MAWSMWRKVLVAALGSVGLASVGLVWSQTLPPLPGTPKSEPLPLPAVPSPSTPIIEQTTVITPSAPKATAERIMTVFENGQSLRCRVLNTWRQANGVLAYQLEVIDTGEVLTIEEAGPPAVQEANRSGRKSLPMRIFHWGKNKTPPQGAPLPPDYHAQLSMPGCPTCVSPESPLMAQPRENPIGPVPATLAQYTPTQVPPSTTATVVQPWTAQTTLVPSAQAPCQTCQPSDNATVSAEWRQPKKNTQQPRGMGGKLRNLFHAKEKEPAAPTTPFAGESGQAAAMPTPTFPPQAGGRSAEGDTSLAQAMPKQPSQTPGTAPHAPGSSQTATNQNPPVPSARTPFSTAMNSTGTPLTVEKNPVKNVSASNAETPAAPTKDNKEVAADKDKAETTKRSWQSMWGKASPGKAQQPGLALEESAGQKGKKDPRSGKQTTTAAEKPPRDILTAPERLPNNPPANQPRPDGSGRVGFMPPGAQSVLAARNGMVNSVTYVPVPMVTIPQPIRPPVAPEPRVPPPPPGPGFNNAFTQPTPPQSRAPQQGYNGIQQATANGPFYPLGPGGIQQAGYYPVPYPQAANPYAYGYPPPQGPYPPPYYPAPACANGVCTGGSCANGMCQPGYAPYQPYAYPPQVPYQPYAYPPPRPAAQVYPANYQGQQPYPAPNPYWPTGAQPAYANPAMDRPGVATTSTSMANQLGQLVAVLRESPFPAQREWAATTLATYDWRTQPQIVQVLLNAAQHDPAATVRAGSVYSLAKINANTDAVISTLQTLKNDSDPRVRLEAEHALTHLGATASTAKK